jgi:hypothetical protein
MKKVLLIGLVLLFSFTIVGYAADTLTVPESYHGKITFTTQGSYHYTVPYIGAGSGKDDDYKTTLTETGKLEVDLNCMMFYWQNLEKTIGGNTSLEEKEYFNGKLQSAKIFPDQTLDSHINLPGTTLLVIDFEKKIYGFMTRLVLTGDKLNYDTNTGKQMGGQTGVKDEIKYLIVRNQSLPKSLKSLKGQTTITLTYDGQDPKTVSKNKAKVTPNITTRTILEDKREIVIAWEFIGSATTTETMIMPGTDFSSMLKQE